MTEQPADRDDHADDERDQPRREREQKASPRNRQITEPEADR